MSESQIISQLLRDVRELKREVAELRARRPGALETRREAYAKVSLPEGEYQYMVLQMGSDNQIGMDFIRAHPIVSG